MLRVGYPAILPIELFRDYPEGVELIPIAETLDHDVEIDVWIPDPYSNRALKALPHCRHVAVLTDARFSGVSTGACVGHISPEALAGGPVGKVLEGDRIEIVIDRAKLVGTVNLVGDGEKAFAAEDGARVLKERGLRADLRPHPALPEDTRLWAALVQASGGVWGGCVYDADAIVAKLEKGT